MKLGVAFTWHVHPWEDLLDLVLRADELECHVPRAPTRQCSVASLAQPRHLRGAPLRVSEHASSSLLDLPRRIFAMLGRAV